MLKQKQKQKQNCEQEIKGETPASRPGTATVIQRRDGQVTSPAGVGEESIREKQ